LVGFNIQRIGPQKDSYNTTYKHENTHMVATDYVTLEQTYVMG